MGLQGVTWCGSGLQGITKVYRKLVFELERLAILFLGLFCIKRLQGVTRGDRRLKEIAKDYRKRVF